MDKVFIEKRRQLSAGKKDNYWALAKCTKGYSAIDREIRSLFVAAFNNNLHVTVLPNVKDMLQVKDADSVKVLVCKVLTQIGLGLETSFLILSVISQLSRARPECVRALDSYKQMSDCTK